jgi:hypothetical protein
VIGDRGAPQMMFRLGYGLEPRPTPRRAVDEVLRGIEAGSRRADALAVRSPPPVPERHVPELHVVPQLHVPPQHAERGRAAIR